MPLPLNPELIARQLCLNCGLCCNGVLFKDVELQPGDDGVHLKTLGLSIRASRTKRSGSSFKFPQPCAALCADNSCRLYAERPARCRQFECALFKEVTVRDVTVEAALRTIALARRRVNRVRGLLRKLGDADEGVPLSRRFRRMKTRIESGAADPEVASLFSQLALAMHQLNLLLGEKFYPG